MHLNPLFKRTWQLAWSYRATWLFGALLALTTCNGLFAGYVWRGRDVAAHNTLRLTPALTLNFPGEGLSIDLTQPEAIGIHIGSGGLTGLETVLGGIIPAGVRTVVLSGLILLILCGLVLVTTRYVAEAGLIRMVALTEQDGVLRSVGQGWRLGWSRSAWRLLLIDWLIALVGLAAILVCFALALSPFLLWTTGNILAGALGTALASGLLILDAAATAALLIAVSLVLPVARRQCAAEGLGVSASLHSAIGLIRAHVGQALRVWLAWAGMRLAWMVTMVALVILLAPLVLALLPVGLVAGGVSALAVGGVLTVFLKGALPWIIGCMAGLPALGLVLSAPILVASAPIEVLKSSWWTLAVGELRRLPERALPPTHTEQPAPAPVAPQRICSAPSIAPASGPAPRAAREAHAPAPLTQRPTTKERKRPKATRAPGRRASAKVGSSRGNKAAAGRGARRKTTPRRKG
jgi:hypothetical protein